MCDWVESGNDCMGWCSKAPHGEPKATYSLSEIAQRSFDEKKKFLISQVGSPDYVWFSVWDNTEEYSAAEIRAPWLILYEYDRDEGVKVVET